MSVIAVFPVYADDQNTTEPATSDVIGADDFYVGELGEGCGLYYNFLPPPPWMEAFYYDYGKYRFINYNDEEESYSGFYIVKDGERMLLSAAIEKEYTTIDDIVALIKSKDIPNFNQNNLVDTTVEDCMEPFKDYHFRQNDEPQTTEPTSPTESTSAEESPLYFTYMYLPKSEYGDKVKCRFRFYNDDVDITRDMQKNIDGIFIADVPYGDISKNLIGTAEFITFSEDGTEKLDATEIKDIDASKLSGRINLAERKNNVEMFTIADKITERFGGGWDRLTEIGQVDEYRLLYNDPWAICCWELEFEFCGKYKFHEFGGQRGNNGSEDLGVFLVDDEYNVMNLEEAEKAGVDFDKIVSLLRAYKDEREGIYYTFDIIDIEPETTNVSENIDPTDVTVEEPIISNTFPPDGYEDAAVLDFEFNPGGYKYFYLKRGDEINGEKHHKNTLYNVPKGEYKFKASVMVDEITPSDINFGQPYTFSVDEDNSTVEIEIIEFANGNPPELKCTVIPPQSTQPATEKTEPATAEPQATGKTVKYEDTKVVKPAVKVKANTIKVTVKTKSVKAKKLAKKARKLKSITVKNAVGKVTYKLISVPKKLEKLVKLNKNGVIILAKGKYAKKTYKLKARITAAGNNSYSARKITRTIKIRLI
jgi:hypothetical protein